MGRQQLLLLGVTVVVVGAAIVVLANMYSSNSTKNNYDAILRDMVRIAGDAQLWKSKPELMGGSPDASKSGKANFMEVDFAKMGYSSSNVYGAEAECYANLNGEYQLIGFIGGLAILGRNETSQTLVVAILTGPTQVDLQIIGILRGGAWVTSGEDWSGTFPRLPGC